MQSIEHLACLLLGPFRLILKHCNKERWALLGSQIHKSKYSSSNTLLLEESEYLDICQAMLMMRKVSVFVYSSGRVLYRSFCRSPSSSRKLPSLSSLSFLLIPFHPIALYSSSCLWFSALAFFFLPFCFPAVAFLWGMGIGLYWSLPFG
uniref:Uncharacterized protein n=1 Tax=Opuntia streptacantha TaxID=393608 RepID=A0A7C9EMW5_OPUST